eukprot:764479-Hanusia_phi.AAC.2
MADNGGMYIPTNLQWRIRSLANMRETVNAVIDTDLTSLRFPRNTYSMIQEIQIKCYWSHDVRWVEQEDNGTYYAYSKFQQLATDFAGDNSSSSNTAKDKEVYYIKNFLGILQQGNVNTFDTSLVGTVQITITFASAAVLGLSKLGAGGTKPANPSYTLSDIKANMTKISMPSWYYEGVRNQLMNGTTYELFFPHYSTFFGQASQYKTQTTRFTIASDSLDYLLGTFVYADRDDTTKISTFYCSSDGTPETLGQALIAGGANDITFNQTRYFVRNGTELTSSQWTLGSEKLPQVPNTIKGCCQSVIEAFNLHQSADLGFFIGCQHISDFEDFFFADVLSLQHVGDNGGVMLVSGLNTRDLPISIEWSTKGRVTTGKGVNDPTLIPLIIAVETRRVTIGAGNSVSIN